MNKYLEKIASNPISKGLKALKKQEFHNIVLDDKALPTLITRNRSEQAQHLLGVRKQINSVRAEQRASHEAWKESMKDYW